MLKLSGLSTGDFKLLEIFYKQFLSAETDRDKERVYTQGFMN
jgi:hypothetical protein